MIKIYFLNQKPIMEGWVSGLQIINDKFYVSFSGNVVFISCCQIANLLPMFYLDCHTRVFWL